MRNQPTQCIWFAMRFENTPFSEISLFLHRIRFPFKISLIIRGSFLLFKILRGVRMNWKEMENFQNIENDWYFCYLNLMLTTKCPVGSPIVWGVQFMSQVLPFSSHIIFNDRKNRVLCCISQSILLLRVMQFTHRSFHPV